MELPNTNNLLNAMDIPSKETLFAAAVLSAVIWSTAIVSFFIF